MPDRGRARRSKEMAALVTERRNPASFRLHELSIPGILRLMNEEDRKVPEAVRREIPRIARGVELVVDRLRRGGRLFYLGAGTSGRLGMLDAAEAPPTFGVPPDLVQGIIAGGVKALVESVEGAEDDEAEGARALRERGCSARDIVVGISASGRTPFVLGGLEYAGRVGAARIGLSANPKATLRPLVDVCIAPALGPEVLTGSTRLKAGTAQKLILNMISTAVMIRLGKVVSNLMIDLLPKSRKLVERRERIVRELSGCTLPRARNALARADGDVRRAVALVGRPSPKRRRAGR